MWVCPYCSIFPLYTGMMINEFQLIMISTKDWNASHLLCYKPLAMIYWLFQYLKKCGNGCRSVPGKAIQPSVAPFHGEQPWMGALGAAHHFLSGL